MRIGGWIMFVLGIAFVVVLLIALSNGNGFPLRGLIYAIFLIIAGWRLKSYGTGLVSSAGDAAPKGLFDAASIAGGAGGSSTPLKPASIAGGAEGSSTPLKPVSIAGGAGDSDRPSKPVEIATVEMPFSLGVSDLIRDTAWKSGRILAMMMGLFTVVILVVGFATSQSQSESQATSHSIGALGLTGILVLGCAVLIGALWFFAAGLPAWRDLRARTYWRTRGPIQVVSMGNGLILRLADRAISVSSKGPASSSLRSMDWAVVDYSKHAHVILGVWDFDGKNVFLADGYKPENLILVDANNRI
ncbi:MAG TPA: hypothetical protein VKH15_19035 [Candidatus Acidoferrum sp.]|nr:hypothetical protein [Candidatus Acidoferrum sp.]